MIKKKINECKKMNLKIGDKVKVIAGKDKGKIGNIKTIVKLQGKIIVEGINIKVKHCKVDQSGKGEKIKRMEFPIHRSNVLKYKE